MKQQYSVSFLAQLSGDEQATEGIIKNGPQLVAINKQYSYVGLAEDRGDPTGQTAQLALEILQDDIQTNLSSREYEQATDYEKHILATQCVQESFENINDYLCSQVESATSSDTKRVALSVLLVSHGECSLIHTNEHCCLHFHDGKLQYLSQIRDKKDAAPTLLGISETLNLKTAEKSMASNDLLLICSDELVELVTENFLRVTLSRFADSPEMAMRQISSKAQRSGLQGKPLLAMVAIKADEQQPKSWFRR